ncbi:MAG: hypothetical protein FWE67_09285 [Planctomycetaceae bacterium]|nr:hypothetical protein [Planctomycetaceae bacterium]
MKHLLAFPLSGLFALVSVSAAEIDDSSYESLFKAAYENEMQQNHLSYQTLDAVVKFNGLDLMSLVYQPYRKPEKDEYG